MTGTEEGMPDRHVVREWKQLLLALDYDTLNAFISSTQL
jgi:hypothetical protein